MLFPVGAQKPLTDEAGVFRHCDGCMVVGMGQQLDAHKGEFIEGPSRQDTHGTRRHASTARIDT